MSFNEVADCVISNEESADLIAESVVEGRLNLGHSYIYRLSHPVRGRIIVLNSSVGNGAVLSA